MLKLLKGEQSLASKQITQVNLDQTTKTPEQQEVRAVQMCLVDNLDLWKTSSHTKITIKN